MGRNNQSGIAHLGLVLVIVVVLGAVGAGGYYVWNKNQDKKATPSQSESNDSYTDDDAATSDGWSEPIASGKGAYTVRFPDGWSVTKDTNSDTFLIGGEMQPVTTKGTPASITEAALGSDGPIVLLVTAQDSADMPEGTATEYTLQNGKENPIKGKKYSYEYAADATVGVGTQRLKGDRDYTYVFDMEGGKQLRVAYSVYGSDPRNLVNTVDALVDSIVLQ